MDCEKAKKLIVDFFYDELDSDEVSGLDDHLAKCDDCSEYRQEIELSIKCLDKQEEVPSSVNLSALHEAIEQKRNRNPFKYRIPVWATALFIIFAIAISAFALSKGEIQYGNNTLTISFGQPIKEQPKEQIDYDRIYAEIDKVAQKTAYTLEQYKKEQVNFQDKLSKELGDYRIEMANLISEYDQQSSQRTAELVQQLQAQHYQSLVAIKDEFEFLASRTQNEFERSYMTMAAMAEVLSYNGGQ